MTAESSAIAAVVPTAIIAVAVVATTPISADNDARPDVGWSSVIGVVVVWISVVGGTADNHANAKPRPVSGMSNVFSAAEVMGVPICARKSSRCHQASTYKAD